MHARFPGELKPVEALELDVPAGAPILEAGDLEDGMPRPSPDLDDANRRTTGIEHPSFVSDDRVREHAWLEVFVRGLVGVELVYRRPLVHAAHHHRGWSTGPAAAAARRGRRLLPDALRPAGQRPMSSMR